MDTTAERLRSFDQASDHAMRTRAGEVEPTAQADRVLRPRRRWRLDLDPVEVLGAFDDQPSTIERLFG